ncbi:MAG: hypothetical protein HFG85_09530 [Dorea sp.]|nr:hypothetical protein [Dorea sp.]
MKRFIRYLYECDKGKRLRNVGFVKVEQGEEDCTLHIHGKGLHMRGERQLALYLFYDENGECTGIYQGTVDNVNPAINYRLYYTKEDVAVPDNFPRINGIILESENGRRYAAVWNDTPVDVSRMQVLRPGAERTADMPPEAEDVVEVRNMPEERRAGNAEDIPESEVAGDSVEDRQEQTDAAGRTESLEQTEMPREEGTVRRMDTLQGVNSVQGENPLPLENPSPEVCEEEEIVPEEEPAGESDMTDQEMFTEETFPQEEEIVPEEEPARQDSGVRLQCTKIQRNDLARLPRCEWKWANNSFLLHGYYNYHHLALISDGENYRLGVPGIYHPQEAKAASTFGFTEFIPHEDMTMDLTDDEKSSQDQFGYWCRQVKKPMKM